MKTAKDYVSEMTKEFLKDKELLGEKLVSKIKKALEVNSCLTSCYSLQVERVDDIKGTTSKDSGFYFVLKGTRCGVNFFVNNNLEVVRKPNKNKVRVVKSYNLYNDNNFFEGFWMENF